MEKVFDVIFVVGLIIFTFMISFLDKSLSYNRKKKVLFFFFLIIVVYLGFRNIGLDLEPYRRWYETQRVVSLSELLSNNLLSGRIEPFFVLLASTLKSAGLDFKWFLLISGGIPMFTIYKVIILNEKKYLITTMTFFLLMHFFMGPINIIRHFFAATIYLSALVSLSKGEKNKYYIKSFISIFVHYSNILLLIIKPFLEIRWNKNKYLLTLLFVVFVGIFTNTFVNTLSLDIWGYKYRFVSKFLYYLLYYNDGGYNYHNWLHKFLNNSIAYYPLIFNIVINFIFLNKTESQKNGTFYQLLLNSQIIGSILGVFFVAQGASTFGVRLSFLLSIGNFLLLKELIFKLQSKNRNIVFALFILGLVLYNFLIVMYYAGVHDPKSPFYLL